MGIKERREARLQNLFSQFVSVKGLINYFANEEELDISVVAADLEKLVKNSSDSELPEIGCIDLAGLEFGTLSAMFYRGTLMEWLSDTIGEFGHADESDYFGWMRDDLFPFLQSHEWDVKENFPLWAPSSEITRDYLRSEDGEAKAIEAVRAVQIKDVKGKTFARLMRSIANFPDRYPYYETNPPKLNNDIRPWLHEAGLVNDGANGREAIVFGRIIAEHFKLKGDTLKAK